MRRSPHSYKQGWHEPYVEDPDMIVYICDQCLEWTYAKYLVETDLNADKHLCSEECKAKWEEENRHDYVDDQT